MWQPALGVLFVLGASAVAAADPKDSAPNEPSIPVECHGKLRHPVSAIGGETTGTTITFDKITWELKLSDEAARAFVKDNHKQPVTVIGSLRRVRGVEIPERWIVDVERISPKDPKAEDGVHLTVEGKLKRCGAAGQPAVLSIETNGITWPLDFAADPAFPTQAESLVGKSIVISGRLAGVQNPGSKPRPVLHVEKLEPAANNATSRR